MTPSLEVYRGNYSAYLAQRAERYARQLEEYKSQQEFIEKEEEFIRRNMAGQNTRQAKGRLKRLERLLEEARITPPSTARRLHLHLEAAGRSGDQVLVTHNLAVGYHDEGRPLFTVPNLTLLRGECAAIIGPNGAGKTTFLKTLLEQIPPFSGEVRLGAALNIAYFAQAHEGLHPAWTLMDEIQAAAPKMLPAEIRDYLAKFLFSGDDVFKTVDVLSGGERGRLALACLALKGANLLLLDEPTNHLDLPSQEVLQAMLSDFRGTILLVSHDRYLIDALGTQIWEVLPDERRLNVFEGTYSEYKAARLAAEPIQAPAPAAPRPVEPARPARQGLSKNEQWRRQVRLSEIETDITRLENRITEITRQLENPPGDPGLVTRLAEEYARLQRELETRMEDWAAAAEE
jgi:ATP-binding cassette subfamily F protein 3